MKKVEYRYVALLRAINVGGNSVIKMADLKEIVEFLGFSDVITYIQSGNVLFRSKETDTEKLTKKLEKGLNAAIRYSGKIFVLTLAELKDAAINNPFDPEAHEKEQNCHILFLSKAPDSAHREALKAFEGKEYRFHVHDNILYYCYSKEFAGKRRFLDFEKILGAAGTARTWKVVDKLIELM
jgi:uncharacterized protein (DUF1697 family)